MKQTAFKFFVFSLMHHWRMKHFEYTPLLQRPRVEWLQNLTGQG